MDLYDAIWKRRSVRSFLSREIEDRKLNRILEAGLSAPSASNKQPWRFIVVRNEETRKKLASAARNQNFVAEAPVVLVACGVDPDYVMACGQHAYTVDVSIAVDHITLAAVVEGLGTCWIGAFYEDQVKSLLSIPENVRVVALLPMGYPADHPAPTQRKSFENRVTGERWAESWSAASGEKHDDKEAAPPEKTPKEEVKANSFENTEKDVPKAPTRAVTSETGTRTKKTTKSAKKPATKTAKKAPPKPRIKAASVKKTGTRKTSKKAKTTPKP